MKNTTERLGLSPINIYIFYFIFNIASVFSAVVSNCSIIFTFLIPVYITSALLSLELPFEAREDASNTKMD